MFQRITRYLPHRVVIILALVVMCSGLLLIGTAAAAELDDVVAIVNDRPISKDTFYNTMEDAVGRDVLTQLIADALVLEAAEEMHYVVDEAIVDIQMQAIKAPFSSEAEYLQVLAANGLTEESLRARIRLNMMIEYLAYVDVTVSEQEILDYFNANSAALAIPAANRVSHILVETLEEANAIIEQLKAGADFGALAQQYSLDRNSAAKDGDLDFISDNEEILPELRAALNEMMVGQISAPVKTDYGYHILLITERKLSQPARLENVRQQIANTIAQEKALTYEELINNLYAKYKVQVNWEKYKSLSN